MSTAPLFKLQALHAARYHVMLAWFSWRWEYRVARMYASRPRAAWIALQAVRNAPPIPF